MQGLVWSALASLWLGLYQHIYSESLALRGKIYTAKAEQVAVQNQTTTPSFFCSTATPLYYPAALSGLLHVGQVYDPSLSEEGSKCWSPLKVDTFDTFVSLLCCGHTGWPQRGDYQPLASSLFSCIYIVILQIRTFACGEV